MKKGSPPNPLPKTFNMSFVWCGGEDRLSPLQEIAYNPPNDAYITIERLFGKEQTIEEKNYKLPDLHNIRKNHPKAKKY
ncbi:hypothetical protein [Ruminococcus sp. YE78]|uniref:hypothetical protein n=1 Tax=Ruminococcus sp. YE78 TaxID=1352374 RepID=UPI001A9A3999|nr:hypothetical protein [Ruminococcus sp. YE78]